MPTGPQRLFTPPEGPARKTEWPDASKEMRPTGEMGEPRTLSFRDVPTFPGASDTQRIRPIAGNFRHKPREQQLSMFHSAREIMSGWRAHEGDRRYVNSMVSAGGKRASALIVRGVVVHDHPEGKPVSVETDTQMWERKGEEAHSAEYAERHGRERSLVEHLRTKAGRRDMPPIPLAHLANPVDKDVDPRPMVAGGQHRIAAMMHLNPDQLLPVVHHEDIIEAKMTKGYT